MRNALVDKGSTEGKDLRRARINYGQRILQSKILMEGKGLKGSSGKVS